LRDTAPTNATGSVHISGALDELSQASRRFLDKLAAKDAAALTLSRKRADLAELNTRREVVPALVEVEVAVPRLRPAVR
jgi:hypothetical protein